MALYRIGMSEECYVVYKVEAESLDEALDDIQTGTISTVSAHVVDTEVVDVEVINE
jgi:hypothetical protein